MSAEPITKSVIAPSQTTATETNIECPLGGTLKSISIKLLDASSPVLVRAAIQDTREGTRVYLIELGQLWITNNGAYTATHFSFIGSVPLSRGLDSWLNVEIYNYTGADKNVRVIATFED